MMLSDPKSSQAVESPGLISSEGTIASSSTVNSLRELMDLVSGRRVKSAEFQEDSGLAEQLPYPFLGIVDQMEMKLSLLLSLINPQVSGVLLIGPRGTGKTTAVRSLLDILPDVERSNCFFGCMPEDIEAGGMDAVCPDCAKKYSEGILLSKSDKVRLFELPLNSKLDDVIGGIDERSIASDRVRLKKGILALAHLNLLYVDEVNLLNDEIINAILDASSHGTYTVRRGPITATYKAKFTLIGSMNPEEGSIRPQIMDRFGLRIIVHGLEKPEAREEAYKRVRIYKNNSRLLISQYAQEMEWLRKDIITARQYLPKIQLSSEIAQKGINIIENLKIDSLRAEITLFEAARALAAADFRNEVTLHDIQTVAPMALRMRRSKFMAEFLNKSNQEENEMHKTIQKILFS